MKEVPDKVVEYRPYFCNSCGETLENETALLASRKQEIELPPIIPQYIEHQSYSCCCKKCGFTTISELPKRLLGNIQYGTTIGAWVAYFSVRQYISYQRIAELMKNCFNLSLSQGTIDNMLCALTEKANTIYGQIQKRIEQSSVVGGDETGIKIKGKKGWLFVFQTTLLTFLSVSFSRGYDAILSVFKNGFPISIYVSDCLPAQLKIRAKLHQICLAHLLRELNNFMEAFNCEWSSQMKKLLQAAIQLKTQLRQEDYLSPNEKVLLIHEQLHSLLNADFSNRHKKVQTFIRRLQKNNQFILTFLYHPKVPPDNNGSERAIRTAKVKMKVSGQFQTIAGAHRFAVLRSIIDTTIKNSQNVLAALCQLPNLAAE